jgi:hypothetical protein
VEGIRDISRKETATITAPAAMYRSPGRRRIKARPPVWAAAGAATPSRNAKSSGEPIDTRVLRVRIGKGALALTA